MNNEAKKFRSKYSAQIQPLNINEEEFDSSIGNLIRLKSTFEASVEYKVKCKEKTVEERVEDLRHYIEEDIEL